MNRYPLRPVNGFSHRPERWWYHGKSGVRRFITKRHGQPTYRVWERVQYTREKRVLKNRVWDSAELVWVTNTETLWKNVLLGKFETLEAAQAAVLLME